MRVIIAGSRTFNDYEFLKSKMDSILRNTTEPVTIVSGGARGADTLAIMYAKERGLSIILCNANWNKFGKRAGHLRNLEMAEISDALVLFWDGVSRGSAGMKIIAQKKSLKIREFIY